MAKRSIEGSTLTAIADATRNLTGATGLLTPKQIIDLLHTEANSGKVEVETCNVVVEFEDNTDIRYTSESLSDVYEYAGDIGTKTYKVLKNSIMMLDSNCGSGTVTNGTSSIIARSDMGYQWGWVYIAAITGDCTIRLMLI